MDNFSRAMAYLDKLPNAVSGSGGHNATLRAACECYRFGLSPSEVWSAMEWFNTHRCQPVWNEHELRHKIADAEKIVSAKGQHAQHIGGRMRSQMSRTFVAPPAPRRPKPFVPISQRSEAEEEAWWAKVFAERGVADPADPNSVPPQSEPDDGYWAFIAGEIPTEVES